MDFSVPRISATLLALAVVACTAIGAEPPPSPIQKAEAALKQALAEKAAAEKSLQEKIVAAEKSALKLAAEKAYAADLALRQLQADKAKAETLLAQKSPALEQAKAAFQKAQQAAAEAAEAKSSAEVALAGKTAATARLKDRLASEQDADRKKELQAVVAEAEADCGASEQRSAAVARQYKVAAEKAATAKAASEKLAAECGAATELVKKAAMALPASYDASAATRAAAIGGLKPLAAASWDYFKARHLLLRAGFGGEPEEVARLYKLGLHAAVTELVNYHRRPACTLAIDIQPQQPLLAYEQQLEPPEREELRSGRERVERAQQAQLRQWWIRRMAETSRPLEEKLALFWHDHFATGYEDKFYRSLPLYQQNQLFRKYADRYDALLREIVHDPAMIVYLDNQTNIKGRGNENLGREVLELFSLGRDQGYSEQDLRELARALTGYTYSRETDQFRYRGTQHDDTPKTILGKTGNWSADEAIDIILQHPSTARYIATKLFQFFAHRSPDSETIDKLAHVLRANSYDLNPLLENLFLSEEFYSARALAQEIKSPAELMVGLIRTLKLQNVNYASVDGRMQAMGMTLFQPPNVAGWDEGRAWISANRIMLRYNAAANLVDQPAVDVLAVLPSNVQSPSEIVDFLTRSLLVIDPIPSERKVLLDYVASLPPASQWPQQRDQVNARLRGLVTLIVSSPEFQVD